MERNQQVIVTDSLGNESIGRYIGTHYKDGVNYDIVEMDYMYEVEYEPGRVRPYIAETK